mgnify:CR=1 FL=1
MRHERFFFVGDHLPQQALFRLIRDDRLADRSAFEQVFAIGQIELGLGPITAVTFEALRDEDRSHL